MKHWKGTWDPVCLDGAWRLWGLWRLSGGQAVHREPPNVSVCRSCYGASTFPGRSLSHYWNFTSYFLQSHECLSSISSYGRKSEKALVSLLIRALIPFRRAPPSRGNHLPKTLCQHQPLGVRISTYEFLGSHQHSAHNASWAKESDVDSADPWECWC